MEQEQRRVEEEAAPESAARKETEDGEFATFFYELLAEQRY